MWLSEVKVGMTVRKDGHPYVVQSVHRFPPCRDPSVEPRLWKFASYEVVFTDGAFFMDWDDEDKVYLQADDAQG